MTRQDVAAERGALDLVGNLDVEASRAQSALQAELEPADAGKEGSEDHDITSIRSHSPGRLCASA